jgi:hypothetical protein
MQVAHACTAYRDSRLVLKLPSHPASSTTCTLLPTVKHTTQHTAMHAKPGMVRYRDSQSADTAAQDTAPAAPRQTRTPQLEHQVQQLQDTGMMPTGVRGRAVVVGAGPAGESKLYDQLNE